MSTIRNSSPGAASSIVRSARDYAADMNGLLSTTDRDVFKNALVKKKRRKAAFKHWLENRGKK